MNTNHNEVVMNHHYEPMPSNLCREAQLTNSQYYLKELVKVTEYNLAEICKLSGIPRTTITRLYQGISKNLNIKNFSRLLNLYLKTTSIN